MWTAQSLILLILYIILAFAYGGILIRNGQTGTGIMIIFVFIVTGILLGFDTNCLTVGDCNIWSWIRTVILCLQPIIMLLVLIGITRSDNNVMTARYY